MKIVSLLVLSSMVIVAQNTQTTNQPPGPSRSVVAGTTLPATCSVGQIFFKTNATAGSNLYGCTSTNTWTLLGGSSGGTCPSGAANLIQKTNGTDCAASTITDTGTLISTTTATRLSNLTVLGGVNYAASSTGSDTYTASMTPALTSYVAGFCVNFYPSATSNTGAATLNIDSLGAKSIKTSNGNDPADGAIQAGSAYLLCYDGTNFLMQQDNSTSGGGTNTISITGSNAINGKFYFQKLTLTGNSTISSITNIKSGLYVFIVCQDGTGGWTLAWPASVLGGMTIGSTASKCNTQEFASDGTSLYATTAGVVNE